MLPVLHFTSQRKLMGRHRSGNVLIGLSTILALLVISAAIILITQFVQEFTMPAIAAVCVYGIIYCAVCVRMVWTEVVAIASGMRWLLSCTFGCAAPARSPATSLRSSSGLAEVDQPEAEPLPSSGSSRSFS